MKKMSKRVSQPEQTKYEDWELGSGVTLILFSGKISSGKSTAAHILRGLISKDFPFVMVDNFARPVKESAKSCFGWDGKKDKKGRRLLQVIGTDAGRMYNKNIWVEKVYKDLMDLVLLPNVVIFDDWRFENEYEYFLDKSEVGKVIKIRVFREEEQDSSHISEHALPETGSDYYDYHLCNDGTIEELKEKIKEMREEIL